MGTNEVRQRYLDFFKAQEHVEIPSSSLVPEGDPTTLFTGSGMQPMMPYLLGKKHPLGTRIVNSQKGFRAQDIDEVGDNRHTTTFEMLGNWSFGDYFKEEQLHWIFQFLIAELGLNPNRLYVSVFRGNEKIPRDNEAVEIWQKLFASIGIEAKAVNDAEENGLQGGRIFFYDAEENWWSRVGLPEEMSPGEPGGPDSEIFFDFGPEHKLHENSAWANQPCHPACDCGRFLEICNNVFMTYKKLGNGNFEELPQKNIDFGGGLERIVAATEDMPDIFLIDSFKPLIDTIVDVTGASYKGKNQPPMRIIADHLKGVAFLIADGVQPSNKDQGYYLRRLLRRAATQFYVLAGELASADAMRRVSNLVVDFYREQYFDTKTSANTVGKVIIEELDKFNQALARGLREIKKVNPEKVGGEFAFQLYQSYGLPFEVTQAVLAKHDAKVNQPMFNAAYKKHQKISRAGAKKKFRSGLADQSEGTVKLHTATHLLHQALRDVLGKHVQQKGSNITADRLRFDFSHAEKLSDDEIAAIERIVNKKIDENLPVTVKGVLYEQAIEQGALAFFGEKYPKMVTVYSIGDYSKEVCTGPHVKHTGRLGQFGIVKQESVGKGIRRIRAILG